MRRRYFLLGWEGGVKRAAACARAVRRRRRCLLRWEGGVKSAAACAQAVCRRRCLIRLEAGVVPELRAAAACYACAGAARRGCSRVGGGGTWRAVSHRERGVFPGKTFPRRGGG